MTFLIWFLIGLFSSLWAGGVIIVYSMGLANPERTIPAWKLFLLSLAWPVLWLYMKLIHQRREVRQ